MKVFGGQLQAAWFVAATLEEHLKKGDSGDAADEKRAAQAIIVIEAASILVRALAHHCSTFEPDEAIGARPLGFSTKYRALWYRRDDIGELVRSARREGLRLPDRLPATKTFDVMRNQGQFTRKTCGFLKSNAYEKWEARGTFDASQVLDGIVAEMLGTEARVDPRRLAFSGVLIGGACNALNWVGFRSRDDVTKYVRRVAPELRGKPLADALRHIGPVQRAKLLAPDAEEYGKLRQRELPAVERARPTTSEASVAPAQTETPAALAAEHVRQPLAEEKAGGVSNSPAVGTGKDEDAQEKWLRRYRRLRPEEARVLQLLAAIRSLNTPVMDDVLLGVATLTGMKEGEFLQSVERLEGRGWISREGNQIDVPGELLNAIRSRIVNWKTWDSVIGDLIDRTLDDTQVLRPTARLSLLQGFPGYLPTRPWGEKTDDRRFRRAREVARHRRVARTIPDATPQDEPWGGWLRELADGLADYAAVEAYLQNDPEDVRAEWEVRLVEYAAGNGDIEWVMTKLATTRNEQLSNQADALLFQCVGQGYFELPSRLAKYAAEHPEHHEWVKRVANMFDASLWEGEDATLMEFLSADR